MADRVRLPAERPSITRGFEVPFEGPGSACFKFYVVAGVYEDGRIAELFISTDRKSDQMSSLLAGMLDTIAMTVSIGLQRGVPLEDYLAKMRHSKFGPHGQTADAEFPFCTSLFDLMAQWLGARFPDGILKR